VSWLICGRRLVKFVETVLSRVARINQMAAGWVDWTATASPPTNQLVALSYEMLKPPQGAVIRIN
jgi:hypothetical protein